MVYLLGGGCVGWFRNGDPGAIVDGGGTAVSRLDISSSASNSALCIASSSLCCLVCCCNKLFKCVDCPVIKI